MGKGTKEAAHLIESNTNLKVLKQHANHRKFLKCVPAFKLEIFGRERRGKRKERRRHEKKKRSCKGRRREGSGPPVT